MKNIFERFAIRSRDTGEFLDFGHIGLSGKTSFWLTDIVTIHDHDQVKWIQNMFAKCNPDLERLGNEEGLAVYPVTITISEQEV